MIWKWVTYYCSKSFQRYAEVKSITIVISSYDSLAQKL